MEPGTLIVAATDGLLEAQNATGEMFGKQRLREIVRQVAREPDASARRAVEAVDAALTQFLGGAQVTDDVTCLRGWGFELIKHDFSTYDLLGRWGPQMGAVLDDGRWRPHDPNLTTAEALVSLYQCIRDAAGDTVVLGCNVVGHLAAGLVEAQRIGDDTSGLAWGRTRRVGVNTLAFRLAQHGALFAVDADCVPSTPHTPWSLNRRFLDLVSRSGTALFVSVDPSTRSDAVDADLAAGLRLALDGGARGGVEPIDWLHTTSPSRWRGGEAELTYDWLEPWGGDPFESWPLQGPAVDS
jgi:alpha-galactosidase